MHLPTLYTTALLYSALVQRCSPARLFFDLNLCCLALPLLPPSHVSTATCTPEKTVSLVTCARVINKWGGNGGQRFRTAASVYSNSLLGYPLDGGICQAKYIFIRVYYWGGAVLSAPPQPCFVFKYEIFVKLVKSAR